MEKCICLNTNYYNSPLKIDLNKKNDILASPLWQSPAQTANELALEFQSTLSELLDRQIPFKIKRVVERTPQPWFNSAISEAKRRRSQLERWWRHFRLPSDHIKFKQQCKHVRKVAENLFHLQNLRIYLI